MSLVLGLESSCDETAAAVVADGRRIVSNVVASQVALHAPHGGVVPELASRQHLCKVVPVVDRAMQEAQAQWADLTGIAVTQGPGLVGALLVGLQVAKALAYVHRLPLVGINHLEGHLCAVRLTEDEPVERFAALLVSGGHTALVSVEGFGCYRWLGATRDDAAGEAFDKVAKLLGLGYPGGPIIEQRANRGDPTRVRLPRALAHKGELDFSFSGLKTAVANYVASAGTLSDAQIDDLCASFQQAVTDVLVRKTLAAAEASGHRVVVASGGVLANSAIRAQLSSALSAAAIRLLLPPIGLCTDNAAMIAAAGAVRLQRGEFSDLTLNASARLPLARSAA